MINPTQKMCRIVDKKYKKSDLNKFMTKQYHHLSTKEQKRLLLLKRKFEYMFDVTLGTWNTNPLDLELIDDAKI